MRVCLGFTDVDILNGLHLPIARQLEPSVAHQKIVSRRQLENALESRVGRHLESRWSVESNDVRPCLNQGGRQQGLDLRSEYESLALLIVVKGFDPEPIPRAK